MGHRENVGILTSGGLAPCLSSSIASLIKSWTTALNNPDNPLQSLTIRCYRHGYRGVLKGDSFLLEADQWDKVDYLYNLGGSPIGNSRVKLTNVKDCVERGLVPEGQTPQEVAAEQLVKDGITTLHTIGGDDTNTEAAKLSNFIWRKYGGARIKIVGMPKTIDNDVSPIVQTLGADTAAEEGARLFSNVVSEGSASPRTLIIHEIMGRRSGFLTAATALKYRELQAKSMKHLPLRGGSPFDVCQGSRDVHAVWIPELNDSFDIEKEGERLNRVMNEYKQVNVFLCEGFNLDQIVKEKKEKGEDLPCDAFGHVAQDKINPGEYYSNVVKDLVKAEKTMIQKTGYLARSAPSNAFDLDLIARFADVAVESAIADISGCIGQDDAQEGHPVRAIEFDRIAGEKPFDASAEDFQSLLHDIGQTAV